MSLVSKILFRWHVVSKNYHLMLLEGCIDHNLKADLNEKISYHEKKLKKLESI